MLEYAARECSSKYILARQMALEMSEGVVSMSPADSSLLFQRREQTRTLQTE